MRTIAISLSKGGVGKTTTAVNLAAGLAMSNCRVLLVDTDTQGQAGAMLNVETGPGLAEVMLEEKTPSEVIVEARERLFLMAGGRALAGAQRSIARKDFGGEKVLSEALSPLAGAYDYILLDTPPGWSAMTINALFYANEVLSPIALEAMAVKSLLNFQESLSSIQQYHQTLSLKYVVPTFLDRRVKKSAEIFGMLIKHYGDLVCDPIRYNVRVSEAPAFGQTIWEYDKNCAGARDYMALTRRIIEDAKTKGDS